MLANRHDIIEYIPQRTPMVMVHELLSADEHTATTKYNVETGTLFIKDDLLAEAGLMENIAQTAAAHMGYTSRKKNVPTPLGYIAAIRNMSVLALPPVGTQITTTVEIKDRVMDFILVQGTVRHNNVTICTGEIRVFCQT